MAFRSLSNSIKNVAKFNAVVASLNTTRGLTVSSSRHCGWIRDWKPGPPPKTEAEMVAAARKYNLIREDYEFYDESEGLGDYPKLPAVGQDARDPYDDFDYHYYRGNYGEPLHANADIYTSDRHDPNEKTRYTPFQMFFSFWGLFIGSVALCTWLTLNDWRWDNPQKPKQYPGPGKIHYTFEPEYD